MYNIPHPDIDPMSSIEQVASGLTPYYSTTEKMKKAFLNSRAIQNLVYTILNSLTDELADSLPEYL